MWIYSLFCKHEYSEVDERGYQRCKHCNKSIYVGFQECKHTWEIHKEIALKSVYTKTEHVLFVQKCSKCGQLMNHSSNN